MTPSATLTWFAQHEFRLAWREWLSMMSAGRRWRERAVAIVLIIFAALMHLIAWIVVAPYADVGPNADKARLVVISGSLLLSWSLMLSQAMESVTRAFYSRSDLDVILSSPIDARRVFCVRIVAMTVSVILMALLLAAPFINVLMVYGGIRWIGAYGVVVAMGATATALAVALTVGLFRVIGPKRTRFVAQIVAAVVGAAFVIGLQIGAIFYYGTLSRFAILQSGAFVALLPGVDSLVWWPARAIVGDLSALAAVMGVSIVLLAAAIATFASKFADHALAAAGVSSDTRLQRRRSPHFRRQSAERALRGKEFALLRRDPWLMSQTLMQLLYLAPPAFMLWRSFGQGSGGLALLVPVLVMASGQLAGGLAWLAISGEDAPDLVATAPISTGQIVRAKIATVMICIAAVFAPFVLLLAITSWFYALVSAAGIAIAAASASQIQLWFRAQAKRRHFRRRQTSSRIATFMEAFSSITWAAAAALTAAQTWFALAALVASLAIMTIAKLMSPCAK